MGISGLLPLLSEAQRKGHIDELSGKTVGVDSYIWLYKGAFSCAVEIGLNQPTTKYVAFFMTRARMLRHYGVEPLFVFDGGPLPSKRATELERQKHRMERRLQALELWAQSKKKKAFEMFQRSLEATPQMAKVVIEELKREGFRYLVAPYEADAQLAYLERTGVIAASISEDSDLVAFGCKRAVFKLDQYGECVMFERSKMEQTQAVDLSGWSAQRVRWMCILSGCDYAASVPGIGLRRAYRYAARATSILDAVRRMRADSIAVPEGYEALVERAEQTFMYQRVYDPQLKRLAHVLELAEGVCVETMPFVGEALEPQIAQQIAEADIDPFTYEPFDMSAPLVAVESSSNTENESASARPPAKPTDASPAPAKTPAKPAAPAPRAGTLVSLWKKKSAFATISVKPTKPPAAAPLASSSTPESSVFQAADDSVRVKFRARDSRGETVATPERSKFFAKRPSELTVEQLDASWSQSSLFASEEPSTQTQVDDSEPSPVDEGSQTQTVELPPEPKTKRGLVSLFDQFQSKQPDVPDWIASPKYRKGN
ncbi:Rad2 nuclease [Coemansia sp. RSA 2610]|nr:Rad2 nuclease [Coemansia sp. RSA 2610]